MTALRQLCVGVVLATAGAGLANENRFASHAEAMAWLIRELTPGTTEIRIT